MIKIEELRIGNSVLFNNEVDNITELGQANNGYCEKNGYFNFDKLTVEPIELTEEWLIKFGFENLGQYGYGIEYFHIRTFTIDKPYYFPLEGKRIYIKYVHQLQNLYFALTGTELDTK